MITHALTQGSPEWHAHRANYFNASDAPAMLGVSPYKSRTQLLHEKYTGLAPEVNAATQRIFDDGHRFEALARPLAEQIIGEELSPVTGTEGKLSASFDGLTLMEDIAFEHKTLNDALRACNDAADLPEHYRVQMEQQLMVSGADKVLFMATKWDVNGELVEEKHFWYYPDLALRQRIIDGWAQFEKDLAAYVPKVVAEQPKAEVVLELPALFIQAKGEITTSNMSEYGEALKKRLAEVRAIALISDQDFANAKGAAKLLRENIEQAKLAKDAMLAQTVTVGEAARMIDAWCEDMRLTALKLEKDVEREDIAKKSAMITEAIAAYSELLAQYEAETHPIKLIITKPDFAGAIKGKRNYESMQHAIDDALASATIALNGVASDIRAKLNFCKENASGYQFLFADMQQVIYKQFDDFQLLVNSRISEHQRIEDEKAARIQAEAKAQAEAEAKKQAEAQAAQAIAAANVVAPVIAAPVAAPAIDTRAAVIEHQDEISAFLAARDFGKEAGKVRAILVEFIKFKSTYNIKKAA